MALAETIVPVNSKEFILENWLNIVNKFFDDFGLKPLELDIKRVIKDGEEIIASEKDKYKRDIYESIVKLTSYNGHNLSTIPKLANLCLENGDDKLKQTYQSILVKAETLGLYVDNGGVLMTSKFQNYLKDNFSNFKSFKTSQSFKKCFSKEDKIYYVHSKNGDINKLTKLFMANSRYELKKLDKPKYGLYWELIGHIPTKITKSDEEMREWWVQRLVKI